MPDSRQRRAFPRILADSAAALLLVLIAARVAGWLP